MGASHFSLFLAGPSGAFKSQTAALAQQHFGAGLDALHLPASWTSTENSLEGLAFMAKDTLLVIDDFAPRGATAEVQRLHAKADRVLRAQGNNSGRGRMNADTSLRPSKPPRGLILSTGEDVPQGHSLRARLLILDVAPGDINKESLTHCQTDAGRGLYAEAMAGFLWWLSPRMEGFDKSLKREVEELREQVRGSHNRTPETVAHLAIALHRFLQFAKETCAFSKQEAAELWERGWEALNVAANKQTAYLTANEPASRFVELLKAALGAGRAHVAALNGDAPQNPRAWGWRRATSSDPDELKPQGERIGWVTQDDLYLLSDAALNVARRMGGDDGVSISLKTMHKRLREHGHLLSIDEGRGTLTVRRQAEGARRDVLHLHARLLCDEKPAQSSLTDALEAPFETTFEANGQVGQISLDYPALHAPQDTMQPSQQYPAELVPAQLNGWHS